MKRDDDFAFEILDCLDRNKARRVTKTLVDDGAIRHDCPNCGRLLGYFYTEPVTLNFCPNCGQRLEWEDDSDVD